MLRDDVAESSSRLAQDIDGYQWISVDMGGCVMGFLSSLGGLFRKPTASSSTNPVHDVGIGSASAPAQIYALPVLPDPVFDDGTPITLQGLLQKAKHLTPMSNVAGELLIEVQKPQCSLDKICFIVEKDQAISAAILRMANSSFYRPISPITSLRTAISRIGLRGIYDLALSASVLKIPTKSAKLADELRKEMLATAAVCRVVANYTPRGLGEHAFIYGLLLEVGRFLFSLAIPERYGEVCTLSRAHHIPIHHLERSWVSFDHADAGALLLEQWRLPKPIVTVIEYQYKWTTLLQSRQEEELLYACIANVARDVALAIRSNDVDKTPLFAAIQASSAQQFLDISKSAWKNLPMECAENIFEATNTFSG